jgi:sugar/nucleoside kinase (ribokinase family)
VHYRRDSAASRLVPADVPEEALEDVELVHLTGITIAIGAGALVVAEDAGRSVLASY